MTKLAEWLTHQVIGNKLKESFISWLRQRLGDEEYLNQENYDSFYEEFLNEWTEKNRKSTFRALFGK